MEFPFDPRLGRHPDRPTRGWEETFVIRKILSANGTGYWLRDADVTHHIDETRQTSSFLRSYYFDVGFVHSFENSRHAPRARGARHLTRGLCNAGKNEITYVAQTLAGIRANRTAHLRQAAENWGRAKAGLVILLHGQGHVPWSQSSP
jgi:hypothetical protein